ncbi:MAG: Bacterial domain [Bacteroidota bacterium]|jgi:hypothetical protein
MKFEIMSKIIPSSYDRTSIWIIQAFLTLLVLIAFLVQDNYAFIISIGLIFLLAIGASLILVPFQIQMHDTKLVLRRFAGNIEIRIEDILQIQAIDYAELRRKIGIDGLFGFYGFYDLTSVGRVKLMAKSKQQMVLILSSNLEPIVVSVDNVKDLY